MARLIDADATSDLLITMAKQYEDMWGVQVAYGLHLAATIITSDVIPTVDTIKTMINEDKT